MRPKFVTYSRDVFQKSIRFCNVGKVIAKMKQVYQPTLKDPGDMTTMPKQRHNTTTLQRPERFGYVVHFDIVYGSGTAIGG